MNREKNILNDIELKIIINFFNLIKIKLSNYIINKFV